MRRLITEARYAVATEPDPDEEHEARAIVEFADSLEELASVIGKPDEMMSAAASDSTGFMAALHRVHERYPETFISDANYRWTRYARYGKKWPTLCLDVYEYPDGRLEPAVTGLRPGHFVIIERRPWWSRLLPQRTKTA